MTRWGFVLLFAAACGAALAEAPPPPATSAEGGRFSMTPAKDGFLRLDKDTGAVSFCSVQEGLANCRIGADERAAFETEIARLRAENTDLKAKAAGVGQGAQALPSEQQFEQALSFTERFLRRIMRLFREEAPQGDRL